MVTEILSDILPFRWQRPEGIRERWDEFLPLIEAYKLASRDELSVEELGAELTATIREHGAVFVALGGDRRLAGYACARLTSIGEQRYLTITQWWKQPASGDEANCITDAFFSLIREYGKEQNATRIKLETRAVTADGAVRGPFRRLLERLGFRAAYCGLEAAIGDDDAQ